MKKILCSFLPLLLFANVKSIIDGVDNNALLQAKGYEEAAKGALFRANEGKNLPTIDAKLSAVYLNTTPTMYLHMPRMPVTALPAGKKERYEGEVALRYPLFSGFAITALVEKSKFAYLKAKLEKKDLARRLYMKALELYAALYSVQRSQNALKHALKALQLSYKKAKGLYEQDLLPQSELLNIEAKQYEIEAKLEDSKSKKEQIKNSLFYLVGFVPKSVALEDVALVKNLDISQRADIKALQKALQMDRSDIKLAKSAYYPKVGIEVAMKRFGDSLALGGDGYQNADRSYVGAAVTYNLFNGFADKEKIEAAKAKYLARQVFLQDYVRKIKTQIKNEMVQLASLKKKLLWAKKRLKAANAYAKLVQGRFANQLASADELSRAIAKEAEAKAFLESAKAAIFLQKCHIDLMHGVDVFKRILR